MNRLQPGDVKPTLDLAGIDIKSLADNLGFASFFFFFEDLPAVLHLYTADDKET